MNWRKASVHTTKPGGTAIPALVSSPRLAPLPPTVSVSERAISAKVRTKDEVTRASSKNGYDAAIAIDPQPLACRDALCGLTGANDRGQAVFASDDCRVRHRPTDIRHGRLDAAEHRSPAWVGDRADQNLTVEDLSDICGGLQHTGDTFDDAW